MIVASRPSTVQLSMSASILVAFLGFILPFCSAQGAAVIVSGGDQSSGSGQAYVVVGDNLASYSGQQSQGGASYNGQTGYIRGQQYQVVSSDDVYGSSSQGGSASSNLQGVYVQPASASQSATDVQLNEVPVQSLSIDLLPAGYQQQLSAVSYGGALGSSSSSAVSDAPAQSVQSSNFAGLNLAAFGIEPASYLAGSGRGSTSSATHSTSKPAATYSAGTSSETGDRRHGTAKRAGGRNRVEEEQEEEEQEPENDDQDQDQDQEAVADEDHPETELNDGGDANLEDANYEVATRVSNSEAKSGYRRRRRRKVKPKVIIVKKVLPLSTTTYRG